MWIMRKRIACKKCGITGFPFYAYRNRNLKKPHLLNRIYVRQLCQLCFREEANTNGRRCYHKNPAKAYKKYKAWEKKNLAYRRSYEQERKRKQRVNRLEYFAEDYGVLNWREK